MRMLTRCVHCTVRLLLLAHLLYAPILCLRFCELRAMLAGGGTSAGTAHQMDQHSAPLHVHAPPDPEPHHSDSQHRQHVPLDELRAMLAALTEFVIALLAWPVVPLVLRLCRCAPAPVRLLLADPPTPPPRGWLLACLAATQSCATHP